MEHERKSANKMDVWRRMWKVAWMDESGNNLYERRQKTITVDPITSLSKNVNKKAFVVCHMVSLCAIVLRALSKNVLYSDWIGK